ncbi:MAG: hypothetical protein WAV15_01110 [Minisyncoccia bacterium]
MQTVVSFEVTDRKVQELQKLFEKFKLEDKEIAGILVYDTESDEILASTYDARKGKNLVAVRKKYSQLGAEAVMEGVYPSGRWNWGMTSVARYTMFATNLVGNYVMAGEFIESKAPSACVEDALEFSLMVNDILSEATT